MTGDTLTLHQTENLAVLEDMSERFESGNLMAAEYELPDLVDEAGIGGPEIGVPSSLYEISGDFFDKCGELMPDSPCGIVQVGVLEDGRLTIPAESQRVMTLGFDATQRDNGNFRWQLIIADKTKGRTEQVLESTPDGDSAYVTCFSVQGTVISKEPIADPSYLASAIRELATSPVAEASITEHHAKQSNARKEVSRFEEEGKELFVNSVYDRKLKEKQEIIENTKFKPTQF
jgi:hypothetical protein